MTTKCNKDLLAKLINFLLDLKDAKPEYVKCLLDDTNKHNMAFMFQDLHKVFPHNEFPNAMLTTNFFELFVGMLVYERMLETPEILSIAYNFASFSCSYSHHRIMKHLEEIGILEALVEVMENENESGMIILEGSKITTSHVLSEFIPALPKTLCFRDLNNLSAGVLFVGRCHLIEIDHRSNIIVATLEKLFPLMYDLCTNSQPSLVQLVLLLKSIYWANHFNILSDFVVIEDLFAFVKSLALSLSADNNIVALAITHALLDKHLQAFENERLHQFLPLCPNMALLMNSDGRRWIKDMCESMIMFWLSIDFSELIINQDVFEIELNDLAKTIEFLLPDYENGTDPLSTVGLRCSRLISLMESTLNLPSQMTFKEPDYLLMKLDQTNGRESFKTCVVSAATLLDSILIDQGFLNYFPDMDDKESRLWSPRSPEDINLGLGLTPSLIRVLGLSHSPDMLRGNPLVQVLRLLSIYHEVNENWGTLFHIHTTEKLIDRKHFVSKNFENVLFNMINEELQQGRKVLWPVSKIAEQYPFLLQFDVRKQLFHKNLLSEATNYTRQDRNHIIDVPRENLANFVSDNRNLFSTNKGYDWRIQFEGELATGHGPVKEFYTEFSRDCQRYDLDLWMGDPVKSSNGVLYVHSQEGLFPKPFSSIQSERLMEALGMVMAKSLSINDTLDINFSKAFYKSMMGVITGVQYLSLEDLKFVMPSTFKFVIGLVEPMIEKWNITKDESLTPEQRRDAISKLKYDGCSFEDLCINFTLPGFPSIEMKKGGANILLSAHNVEEYLQLLIWWLLHKGPEDNFKRLRQGFNHFVPVRFLKLFFYDELDQLFCGVQKEEWTVEYLRGNCDLSDGISEETPVVQYLFEVLSSLSASDQGKFLLFVTSSPRLPCGGLRSLTPTLTIKVRESDGDPDKYLPSSSTCFNVLVINRYSCKETLEERLLFAIRRGSSSFGFV